MYNVRVYKYLHNTKVKILRNDRVMAKLTHVAIRHISTYFVVVGWFGTQSARIQHAL